MNSKTVASNKKARFDFFLEERFIAGLALEGWEVKSLRQGKLNIKESYIKDIKDRMCDALNKRIEKDTHKYQGMKNSLNFTQCMFLFQLLRQKILLLEEFYLFLLYLLFYFFLKGHLNQVLIIFFYYLNFFRL